MHSPFISRRWLRLCCSALGSLAADAPRRDGARRRSGRSSRTSASCSPTGSCSSTPTRRSAPPRSTSWRTARAPSAGPAPPAEGAVATERPASAFDRASSGSAYWRSPLPRPARADEHRRGGGARDVVREPSDKNNGITRHPPAGRRQRHASARRWHRRRLRGRRRQRRDARALRPSSGVDASRAPPSSPTCASRSTAASATTAPTAASPARLRLRLGERLQVRSSLSANTHHDLVRAQLHARPRLHAQLGHRLRRQQHRRRRPAARPACR